MLHFPRMMPATPRAAILLLVLTMPATVYSHPGGLDVYGCHHDTTTGDYHCHRGQFADRHFVSQQAMLEHRASARAHTAASPPAVVRLRTVTRVVDGDTLVLDGNEKVRLIGVDTPETVHPRKPVQFFGKEASDFTKRIATGKVVRLEFDQANAHLGHKDRYGRTLAYVYLPDDVMLNREIIRQGYGHAYTKYPFRMTDEFRSVERDAREHGRGLWGEAVAAGH
ncbi:MAG: thermonuclease family protein [Deltaproteobacteria bacterium]|nr:thermonuclease family protein [Deltaproteobacteria bacterium]MBI3387772.1 thermonuclease family protein [Deltaproteobacteria bacterium]